MMNKFEKQLEKWNNGVLRGAQAKLAKRLHVSTATVALWATGKRHPSKGYLNQLEHIFNLDTYEVSRLFIPSSYIQTNFIEKTQGLHDSINAQNTYSTDRKSYNFQTINSVMLPFFIHLPPQLPLYQETQVSEWWALPRRAAQGAQFLIRAGETDLPAPQAEDVLFIAPTFEWISGCTMLVRKGEKYLVRQIKKQANCLKWKKHEQEYTSVSASAKPIGIVVRRITNTIF